MIKPLTSSLLLTIVTSFGFASSLHIEDDKIEADQPVEASAVEETDERTEQERQ
ncbi:hypothetical protein [Exiguobacterium flavidum]|uniref:hypothetical protein n=1 Tax=Exiguobacterium flavidum TaxID=2184695 RepID=UPI0013001E3D|nr:hypothetical protein [Exiguobacterium flavidum]